MKKGFTLIELIAVIIIIGVVALISTPIVTNVIDKSKEKAYEASIKNIEEAAYKYSIYNNLGYNRLYKELKLDTIQEKGYLQREDIIDPRNDKKMEGCVFYKWLSDENQYDFIYNENCQIEQFYPEIEIVTNDNNKEWMTELLKFEVQGEYEYYKYCIGENNCKPNLEYKGKLEVSKVGKDIYVCATGYIGEEEGNTICTKGFNIDPNKPEITSNKVTYTSSKIIVNATCSDDVSSVKEIKYSINGGEYQESNLFTNLKTGEYKVKTKCVDNALNESVEESTVELKMSAPTIAQVSQTPSSGTWAQKRIIRIIYNNENIENPKYYYSLDNETWIEVSETTKDIEFTSNGYLYAKTVDETGNTANASTFTVTNIDTSVPSAPTIKTNDNKASGTWHSANTTLTFSGSSSVSGITYYYGTSTSAMTKQGSSVTISSNTSGVTYYVKACSGSGVCSTNSSYVVKLDKTTPSAPTLTATDGITSGKWHTANFTLNATGGENISGNTYYYKANQAVTLANGTVGAAYAGNGDTASYTYYVMVCSGAGLCSGNSSYTIKLDTSNPTVSVAVSGKVATLTLKDNLSLVGYTVTTSTTTPTSWTSVTGTSASKSWTASKAGTYYAWVKDSSGRTTYKSFSVASNAFCSYSAGQIWNFAYTGGIQSFAVPCDGTYKLEVWGAQGGSTTDNSNAVGGKGGYSYGNKTLTSGTNLYVVVGGKGKDNNSSLLGSNPSNNTSVTVTGGYNGGASGFVIKNESSQIHTGASGGGATHIGTLNKILSGYGNTSGLYIVAGGGGGSADMLSNKNAYGVGGTGGGNTGGDGTDVYYNGVYNGTGGSQVSGGTGYKSGTFGQGASGHAGGGGGLYGGGSSNGHSGAGGGSGYIGGVTGGSMQNGQRSGDGYARITLVSTN